MIYNFKNMNIKFKNQNFLYICWWSQKNVLPL